MANSKLAAPFLLWTSLRSFPRKQRVQGLRDGRPCGGERLTEFMKPAKPK
jgi:hypothetical protein